MAKALSADLRTRILSDIQAGKSCRSAAARFGVAASTASRLKGAALANRFDPAGTPWQAAMQRQARRSPRLYHCPGGGAARHHHEWQTHRLPAIRATPARLVFIDETSVMNSVKTNMTPFRGRSLKGKRLLADAPFGKWNTQTFIAGLRCDALVAPWVIEGAINGEAFDTYVTTQLAPCLEPGDVLVWDNLNVHKSPRAAETIRKRGAWLLFLPRYSPDLNPIEMAFSKLKTLLRKVKARTYDDRWKAVGQICNLFTAQECWNLYQGRVVMTRDICVPS